MVKTMSYLLLRIEFLILVVSRILLLAVRDQQRTYLNKRFRKKTGVASSRKSSYNFVEDHHID